MVEFPLAPTPKNIEPLHMPQTLQQLSTAAVKDCHLRPGFVRPAYESFCFSGLPGFIEQTLTGANQLRALPPEVTRDVGHYDHVIFVFFDAFGWESFERFRDRVPFLREFERSGLVLQSTSQFPSTTAAHVTTAQSGLAAFEHEICGWDYFEPKVGRMIKPLPFALSGQSERESLLRAGFNPHDILPRSALLPNLTGQGVTVRLHGPEAFYPSSFSKPYASNDMIRGFSSLADGVNAVIETLQHGPRRSYQMLYHDAYDVVCHGAGVGATEADLVARAMLRQFERLLNWRGNPRTLLIVSADHGQIKDLPDGGIAINRVVPSLEGMLKRDCVGEPIYFSGGKRHLCLHPLPECEDFVVAELKRKLDGVATVMTVAEMVGAGLLGPTQPPASYIERLGTVAVLPNPGYSVYWDKFGYGDPSGHGGVSPQEMEVPLLLLPLG